MDIALVVLAKAPLPGLAKTRLARTVGDAAAAALAQRLLEHALTEAVSSGLRVSLCGSPAGHTLLREMAGRAGVTLTAQVEGDLGQRLAAAVHAALEHHDAVMVMGSDCPGLTADALRQAALALECHDAVAYPAHDGGYVLIGFRQLTPGFFDDMPWSTSMVMSETCRRFEGLGARLWLGKSLPDIDTVEDLVHLPPSWPRPLPLEGLIP